MRQIARALSFAATAVLLTIFGVAGHAQAQTPDTIPVLLSASGGISRGAYQAGVNWALVQVFRGSRDAGFRKRHNLNGVYRVAVAAGASAGNVNAAFSAIEYCAPPAGDTPESSLFWQLWANMGWDQLYEPDITNARTDSSLLSRRYVEDHVFPRVTERMARPDALDGCDIPIGITLTKVVRDSVQIRPGLSAATQRLATVFSIREREGRLIFAYPAHDVWSNGALGKVILGPAVAGRDEVNPTWVKNAMQASGAFPIAFQPVTLSYREADRLDDQRRCKVIAPGPATASRAPPGPADRKRQALDEEAARRADRSGLTREDCTTRAVFIDGGLFDNNPLSLALEMYERLSSDTLGQSNARIIYIDTGKLRGDAATAAAQPVIATPSADRGLATILQVAGASLPAARQYELQALARSLANDPRRNWIHVTTRSRPMVGDFLGGFAAFLGKPFREYDFYTGIYDGLQYAATTMTSCDSAAVVEACQVRSLRGMITSGDIPLGTLAPHALRASYEAEYHDTFPVAEEVRATPRDSARLVLLRAMLRATDALVERTRGRPWDDMSNCVRRPWEETTLCTGGFEFMLDVFRDQAGPVLRRWEDDDGCQPKAWEVSPYECPSEKSFADLVQSPRAAVRQTVARLIHQLWRVEDRLGSDPSTAALSHENQVELVDFFYNAFARRQPTGWGLDKDPSSIQSVGQHWWRGVTSLLPYSLSAITDGGKEAGWRPTVNTGLSWLSFTLPATLGYRSMQGRFEPALGVGVLWRTPWVLLSGVEASGHRVHSWKQNREEADAWAAGSTFYLFADRLRVGARYVWEPHPFIQSGEQWAVTIGLNDVNGMLYWFGRRSWLAEPEPRKVRPPAVPASPARPGAGTRDGTSN